MPIVLNTEDVNRYGFWIKTEGIKTQNFQKNPVLLYMHDDWSSSALPIGRIENIRKENGMLLGDPVFDMDDEFAAKVANKYNNGFLFAASIQIDPLTTSDAPEYIKAGQTRSAVLACDLLEASIVKVPGQPNAVKMSAGEDAKIPKLKSDMDKITNELGLKNGAGEDAAVAEIQSLKARLSASNEKRLVAVKLQATAKGLQGEAFDDLLKTSDLDAVEAFVLAYSVPVATLEAIPEKEEGGAPASGAPKTLVTKLGVGMNPDGSPAKAGREGWTWQQWEKEDPSGLVQLKADDPEKYKKLALGYYNAQSGRK